MVGMVSIAAVDAAVMLEAERQIKLILDPPTAEVGAIYEGRVVNITKFGAFVNILPGRDGLLHISKLGGGKRIDRVEDVVDLGDAVAVRVEDIDPNGKISLALAGDESPKASEGSATSAAHSTASSDSSASADEAAGSADSQGNSADAQGNEEASSSDRIEVSFADSFDAELSETFGDLGPNPVRSGGRGSGGGSGGGNGGGRGGQRRRR